MSEPVFEASVRIHADTSTVEREASAGIKQGLDRAEAQAAQRVSAIQQRAVAAAGAPGGPPPPTPPVVPPDLTELERALATARNLAAAPLNIEVLANTKPFERDTTVAFERAGELARAFANDARTAASAAETEFQSALDAALGRGSTEAELAEIGPLVSRSSLTAVAQAKKDIRDSTREILREAEFQVRQIQGEGEEAIIRPAAELETRAATAAIRSGTAESLGDQATADALKLEAAILSTQASAESSKLQAAQFFADSETLASAEGSLSRAEQERLRAAGDGAAAEADRLQAKAEQLRRGGLPPAGVPGAGQEGAGGGILGPGGLLRSRQSGLAGVIGTASRFGLAGAAFSTALAGIGELQKSLRVTGEEAFEMEGKIRNAGAELLTGNLIGGLKALTAQRPAEISSGVTATIKSLQDAGDEYIVTEEKLIAKVKEGGGALEEYVGKLAAVGAVSTDTAIELLFAAEKLTDMEKAAKTAAQAMAEVEHAIAAAGSEAAAFGERGGEFGRGVGGAGVQPGDIIGQQKTGIPRVIRAPDSGGTFQAGTGGEEVAARIRESLSARLASEEERTKFDLQSALAVRKSARSAFETAQEVARGGKQADGAAEEWAKFVEATTGVVTAARAAREATAAAALEVRESHSSTIRDEGDKARFDLQTARSAQTAARSTFETAKAAAEGEKHAGSAKDEWEKYRIATDEVTNATFAAGEAVKAATEAAQDAGNRVREADTAAIRDPGARAQGELGNARVRENQAKEELEAVKGTKKANEALADYREAVSARKQIENSIADTAEATAKTAREKARAEREAAVASAQNAREQALANDIAIAELAGNKAGVRKATNASISYYRELARTAETAESREAAQNTVIGLRGSLKKPEGAEDELFLAQMQNQLTRAETAGNLNKQGRLAQKIVNYWRKEVSELEGVDKEKAQSSLFTAEARKKQVGESRDELELQKIQNRISASRLTKGLGDDKKGADDLVRFWQREVKEATGADKARKQANLIAAKLDQQNLKPEKEAASEGGVGTLDFLGIMRKMQQDFAGNLFPTGSRASMDSLFGGLGAGELAVGGPEEEQVDELRRIRQLIEQRGGLGANVKVEQSFPRSDDSGFQQARWARFAMEEAFNG